MQRLLIVGCGDIAQRAIPMLADRFDVFALTRNAAQRPRLRRLGITPVAGDLDRPASIAKLGGIADIVLHFAPPPNSGDIDVRTANLISALSRAPILPWRLVYLSTSGVYGDRGGARIDECTPASPATGRARRRVDAETRLLRWGRARGVAVCVLRVPGIYAANRLPLSRLRDGTPALIAEEDVFTNHIHADDLARAAVAAIGRGKPGRTYNVCDDSEMKMGDWFDLLADTFGLPRPPRVSRAVAEKLVSPAMMSFMSESRRLDNRRMKHELGVKLLYPTVAAGVAEAKRKLQSAPRDVLPRSLACRSA
jgi:nucleoside-diphosphate-sugar epimerase